jgi:uncharacterized protein
LLEAKGVSVFGSASSEPQFDVSVAYNIMVPMRDGVRMATDVYLPADGVTPLEGPFPVVLQRTPYNKGKQRVMEDRGEFYARRGYAFVVQDCRGRYRSEGEFYFLRQEAEDGYDTVEWIMAQPWCNGKIGTEGTSYGAWVQNAAASLAPEGLSAMYVNQGGYNAHTSSVRHNGTFELRFLAWAFMGAATCPHIAQHQPHLQQALAKASTREWFQKLPLKPGQSPLALAPAYEQWAADIMSNGDYDDYWKHPGFSFEEHAGQHTDCPIIFSGGWYDSYTRSTLDAYIDFTNRKQGPVRVIMGPWTHGGETQNVSFAGDVEFGPDATMQGAFGADFRDHHLRFFDHWLKGLDNGLADEPPVKIFVMGGGDGSRTKEGRIFHGGHWRDEQEWPLARTEYTPFYLRDGGGLDADQPSSDAASTSFRFDPNDPVPTVGGNMSSLSDFVPVSPDIEAKIDLMDRWGMIVKAGGQDQQTTPDTYGAESPYLPLSSRPDVLAFQSEPLENDLEVTGPLTAVLWVSSSAVDTDITVKLIDVYPPNPDYPEGYALNISDSILRLRYRNSREQEELMEPGEICRIEIPMYPTSNVFAAGHRIRLDISSSNFPRFDVNPNTGEPLNRNTRTEIAVNTIHHDQQHPSHILLPVIPSG